MSNIKPDFTMSELEAEVSSLLLAEDEDALTCPELADKFGISENKVRRILDKLGSRVVVVKKFKRNRIGVMQPRPAYRIKD